MRALFLSLLLAALAGNAFAEMKPFELNMDRVEIDAKKPLGFSETYFIPSANLLITASGDVWAQSKAGGSNAQAHGKYFVKGLDRVFVQDLARKVQDDLVTKMRAAGYTVLTYEDLKGEADVAGHSREKVDEKWGLPVRSQNSFDFVFVTPTTEQAFEKPITGPVFWLRDLAKAKNLTVIVPEMVFEVPIMYGQTSSGYKRDSAGIAVSPAMRLNGAAVWTIDGKNRAGNILIQQHGVRLAAEVAGTPKLMSDDQTEFSRSWKRSSSDWVMELDPVAFSDGILRVGYAINDLIVKQAKKAH